MKRATLVLLACAWLAASGLAPAQQFLGKDAMTWEGALVSAKDARARRSAAFALGKLGSSAASAVGSLKKHLANDPDASVREAAAFAIGEIAKESLDLQKDEEAVDALIEKLGKDENALVRRSAAFALGCFGPAAKKAQSALEAALDDKSPEVKQNAAYALGQLGPGAVVSLRKAFQDDDPLVNRDAALSLRANADAARPLLDDLLGCCRKNNSELRNAVLGIIIKIVGPEDTKVAKSLSPLVKDTDREVRQNAALALANIGGPEADPAIPVLLEVLRSADVELRRQAAAAFRNIGPSAAAAIPTLIQTLTDRDRETRANAALSLGGIGPKAETAIPALVARVADGKEDSGVREEAATALARMGPADAAVKAVPTLLNVLGNPASETKVRERVIWALRVHNVNLRDLNVFPTFTKILSENKRPDTRMLRYDCAYMLGVLQGAEAPDITLEVLLDFLKDDTILIFQGKTVKTGGAGTETGVGKANVEEKGKGDGRVMAVQALDRIGARVGQRADIITQLRAIAANPNTAADLKEKSKKLLSDLGK
jgi:HEAT repeat protein